MVAKYFINDDSLSTLNVDYIGYNICQPDHFYGNLSRECYQLHYVTKGKGVFIIDNNEYILHRNTCFFVFPGHVFSFKADSNNPWSFFSVILTGTSIDLIYKSLGISPESPIIYNKKNFNNTKTILQSILDRNSNTLEDNLYRISSIYSIFSLLCGDVVDRNIVTVDQGIKQSNIYIKKAIDYMWMKYPEKISISQVAGYIGLERCYFTKLFKKITKSSPSLFLLNIRLNKANDLLSHSSLTIKQISKLVGFKDFIYFSKVFTKYNGISPSEFKKKFN